MERKMFRLHIFKNGDMERKIKTKFSVLTAAALLLCSIGTQSALAANPEYLIPGGEAVGICVEADGVIIAEITGVETAEGTQTPAQTAGLRPGDVIVKIGARDIRSGEDLITALRYFRLHNISLFKGE